MAERVTTEQDESRHVVAGIATYAAAAMLLVSAAVTILQGISALVHDEVLVVTPHYVYQFNTTIWGWIHLILGIVLAAVALGLFWSTTWARVAAIVIACVSIVSMFMWLPHSPIWAIVTIALDIFVIWAVATWESPWARSRHGR